jgi:hypothetical protein
MGSVFGIRDTVEELDRARNDFLRRVEYAVAHVYYYKLFCTERRIQRELPARLAINIQKPNGEKANAGPRIIRLGDSLGLSSEEHDEGGSQAGTA